MGDRDGTDESDPDEPADAPTDEPDPGEQPRDDGARDGSEEPDATESPDAEDSPESEVEPEVESEVEPAVAPDSDDASEDTSGGADDAEESGPWEQPGVEDVEGPAADENGDDDTPASPPTPGDLEDPNDEGITTGPAEDPDNPDARSRMGEAQDEGGPPDEAPASTGGGGAPDAPTDDLDGGLGGGAAPDDQEMPLSAHVEEMTTRFLAVAIVLIGVAGVTVWYADTVINFLWYSLIATGEPCAQFASHPGPECPEWARPRIYQPLALVLARIKVGTLVGFIVALPVGVYQTYRFMRPGLYPRERRYYIAAVPTSLVLATAGVSFAYYLVLPSLFSYFTKYTERAADVAFGMSETFNLIVIMLGFFAIVFQIPLLVMLAIMMGVTTRRWLEQRRLYFWAGFAAIAFVFSPDPTGMAPLMVAVTMIALFEGTLTLLRWTGSGSLVTVDTLVSARPYAWLLAIAGGYVASGLPVPDGYYDAFPAVVTETLVNLELTGATPIIVAALLIALYEGVSFLVGGLGTSARVRRVMIKTRLALLRLRPFAWIVAIVVGYFASPDPALLSVASDISVGTRTAGIATAAVLVAYELTIAGLRWRRSRN